MSKRKHHSATTPPQFLLRFFKWFCHPDLHRFIEGDLLELYQEQVEEKGKLKANWRFGLDILLLFRPSIIKPLEGKQSLNHYDMFKHHFKITWRSLLNQKLYSSINIGGLAIGLTCFILISLYVQHELSYDKYLSNAKQIYRIYQKQADNFYLGTNLFATTVPELAPVLKDEFPEVTNATTINPTSALIGYEEDNYLEKGLWGMQNFFDVFPYQFVEGNPNTALEKAESIVLTQSLAQKIFGDKDPIGQPLMYRNWKTFTVTGVIEDVPSNSSFQFSFIASILSNWTYKMEMEQQDWNNNDFHTFFTLREGADYLALEAKLPALQEKYILNKQIYERLYKVQALSDLHLDISKNFDIGLKGNPKYITLFSFIAVLVLLLACINYMNLAVARSIKRAKEVGLRKAIGAVRGQLITQFIGESILIAFLALILALILSHFLLPVFGNLLERNIELNLIENPLLVPGLLLLVIFVGVLSGSYPAFFMSSLKPIQVLKGKIQGKLSSTGLQRGLIIGQYATSIVLIISSCIIYQQFQFIQNRELGYNKEHIITVSILDRGLYESFDVIKEEWSSYPDILKVTAAAELPTNVTSGTIISHINERKEEGFDIYRARVDHDYLNVFDIELLAGRYYSPAIASDTINSLVINETAVKMLGWSIEEAISKPVMYNGSPHVIVGVVKDFHMHSMHMKIAPLALQMRDFYFAFIALKVHPNDLAETLTMLEKSIRKYSPYPFEYQFLDERFDQLYKADLKLGEMFGFFTTLSILIASMGLFGLAAFTAEQKTKEIGIRKVLGASVKSIVAMLSIDFLRMVLVGFFIAIPIAWYVMDIWLQDFAYHTAMEWWIFALAGFLAVLVAFFTISSQTLKAAFSNPVDALKDE